MTPQVDVFIPVYGVERFIEKCLQSVLAQDYKNMRVVLIDDASPDQSMALARQVIEKDTPLQHKVEIVSCPINGGLGATRKIAHSMIEGKYTLFLDSDDYWDNEHLVSEWVEVAEKGNYEVVLSNYCHEYPLQGKSIPKEVEPRLTGKEVAYAILNGKEGGYVWNKLFLSEKLMQYSHLVKIGRNFWEDVSVTVPLLYYAEKVGYYPKVTIHYVHHGNTQYTAVTKPEYIGTLEGILKDFEKEFEGTKDQELKQAYNDFKMRIFSILAQLPIRYYKAFRKPIFKVEWALFPHDLRNTIKYFAYFLTQRRYIAWLTSPLYKLALTLHHQLYEEKTYKA